MEPARPRRARRTCPTASRRTGRPSSRPTGRSRMAAPNVAATKPRIANGDSDLARARRATGSPTWPRVLTSMPRGSSTSAAQAMIERERAPPSGKPRNTFIRASTSPCESTSPRRRRRRRRTPRTGSSRHRTGRSRSTSTSAWPSPNGTRDASPAAAAVPSPGRAATRATANTMSARPASPKTFSIADELHPPQDQPHGERSERDDEEVVDP